MRDLSPLQFWGEGRADGGEHLRKIGPLRSGSPYLSSAALRGCHPERSEGSRRALRATTQDQGEILRSLRALIMTTPSTTLTHRAAIAAGRRDNAGARPAASCGAVLAQPFCPPARPFQAACNLNIGCSKCKKGGIHGAETLGPRRVLPKSPVPSPKSLPFWQSPPLPGSPVAFAVHSALRIPHSALEFLRPSGERKSHF